jgi:hypothetical protein
MLYLSSFVSFSPPPIDTKEYFVIKEIDTSNMTTEQAFEALEEISVQATIDSPYVVSL